MTSTCPYSDRLPSEDEVTQERMENRIVISGIGRSATGRRLFIDPLSLTLDACLAAITDAGLQPSDIDGLITWPGEGFVGQGFDSPGIIAVQDALRLSLNWYASG